MNNIYYVLFFLRLKRAAVCQNIARMMIPMNTEIVTIEFVPMSAVVLCDGQTCNEKD